MISDNDLLLYYYRDGLDAAERERIGAALSEQPELAARLHRLVARLDAAAKAPEVPVPPHVQERWRAALDRSEAFDAAASDRSRNERFPTHRWHFAATAAACVLAIVSLVVALQPRPDGALESDSRTQTASATIDPSAYARGLRLHLANTEYRLANLESASDEERSRLIETITAQNRLYAIAAERAGEPQLARVLRAFTPILERLGEDRGEDARAELAQLTFELNVMQARLNAAASDRSTAQSLAL